MGFFTARNKKGFVRDEREKNLKWYEKKETSESVRERDKRKNERRSSIKLVNLMSCAYAMDSLWAVGFIMQFKIYYFIESKPGL